MLDLFHLKMSPQKVKDFLVDLISQRGTQEKECKVHVTQICLQISNLNSHKIPLLLPVNTTVFQERAVIKF